MIRSLIKKIYRKIKSLFWGRSSVVTDRRSETSMCRSRLGKYCIGNGVDLGFGGDPINESAIRIDLPVPYTKVGDYSVQLAGDARNLYWFRDEVLDYVFSSHLLEDFEDVETVLREWFRVLKQGGHLIIFCPDEKIFRGNGFGYNPHHKHQDFSLEFVERILLAIGNINIIHKCPLVDNYSWEIVCIKNYI